MEDDDEDDDDVKEVSHDEITSIVYGALDVLSEVDQVDIKKHDDLKRSLDCEPELLLREIQEQLKDEYGIELHPADFDNIIEVAETVADFLQALEDIFDNQGYAVVDDWND